jgi:hypothetical protein
MAAAALAVIAGYAGPASVHATLSDTEEELDLDCEEKGFSKPSSKERCYASSGNMRVPNIRACS